MDLIQAHILFCMGKTDDAINVIYKDVDELLRGKRFVECDDLLESIIGMDSIPYSADLLLALLVATLPVRYTLPNRDAFLKRVEKVLYERGEYEEGIVLGL